MANKTNAPKKAPKAPNAGGTNQQNHAVPTTKVVDFKELMEGMSSDSVRGLDPNHQVELLNLAHDIYGKDPNAAERYKMKKETVEKINHVVAIGVAVAIAREVTCAKNEFACLMNKAEINTVNEICQDLGISINTNLLPAPDANGNIEVPSAAVEVSDDTKKKLEEEEKTAASNAEIGDVTKIENEEQLIASLNKILVVRPNLYEKIRDAINFYQAYLKIQANKSENKEEELKKVNDIDRCTLFKQMAKLIGACPLVLNQVGRYIHGVTAQTKSPISAFCMFRNTTKNKKTGVYALTNAEIADYVRILVEWTNDVKVAAEKQRIENLKANLEVLKKDEKKNAQGIKDTNAKIETAEKNLAHFEEILSYVLAPTAEVPNKLLEMVDAKDTSAVRMYNAIADCFYDEYNIKEMKRDGVRHNIQQYAGIVTNLFRDPSATLDMYSESNLVELEPIDQSAGAAEKPAEAKGEKPEEGSKKE